MPLPRILYRITARRGFLRRRAHCRVCWYGSRYGGYPVCTERLSSQPVVYSFGTGEDITFDRTMIERFGARVWAFDPMPRAATWVERQEMPEAFRFTAAALGTETGNAEFFLPCNPTHISGSLSEQDRVDGERTIRVEVRTLADIAAANGHASIDILKMDIEGTEYDVLPGILDSGVAVGQILIEFHDRLYPDGRRKTREAVHLLRSRGYEIFAVDELCEVVGFVRK